MLKGMLKNVVGSIAPSLGSAVGGPLGGMATKIICETLGCNADAKSIQTAINNETATAKALKNKASKIANDNKELKTELIKGIELRPNGLFSDRLDYLRYG